MMLACFLDQGRKYFQFSRAAKRPVFRSTWGILAKFQFTLTPSDVLSFLHYSDMHITILLAEMFAKANVTAAYEATRQPHNI